MRLRISIIYPLIIRPIYLAKIDIKRPEVTFEIIGWLGRPSSSETSYNLFISLRLSECFLIAN